MIKKHLTEKAEIYSLFATVTASAMNTFASLLLSGFSSFKLFFVQKPQELLHLAFNPLEQLANTHKDY